MGVVRLKLPKAAGKAFSVPIGFNDPPAWGCGSRWCLGIPHGAAIRAAGLPGQEAGPFLSRGQFLPPYFALHSVHTGFNMFIAYNIPYHTISRGRFALCDAARGSDVRLHMPFGSRLT